MLKWLRRIFGCDHDWELESGPVSNAQLEAFEAVIGECWTLNTYYERTDTGITVYGWACKRCGEKKPAKRSDVVK